MNYLFIKLVVLVTYIAVIVINFLATSLPVNNRSTGEISDAYFNLFTPAGLTFSIWLLIYLLLGGYVLYQFIENSKKRQKLIAELNLLFIGTSLANISWIFAWHYDYIFSSAVIMSGFLFFLIKIMDLIRLERFSFVEKLFIWVPFGVYFGWITVAFIANITVLLVSLGWDGFGVPDYVWTVVVLLVGALIGVLRMHRDKNIAYGLVFVWAYFGILIRHLSSSGFDGQYPAIIFTVIFCLFVFLYFFKRIFIVRGKLVCW